MQIEVSLDDLMEASADGRGRITLGSEYAGKDVTVAILDVEENEED